MPVKVKEYHRVDTLGKSPLDLVIMVYDGAIKSLNQAKEYYHYKETQKGYEELEKTRKFMTHLYTTLDLEKGGEIAEQLRKLYVFVLTQVDVIEATKDLKKIDDNIKILNNLRSGWVSLKKKGVEAGKTGSKKEEDVLAGVSQFTTSA